MSTPNSLSVLAQFSMKDKVVVITGGGRGLGLNFAHALAQCGAHIAGIDLYQTQPDDFSKLASYGGKAKYYQANVCDFEQLKATIDRIAEDFGSIDGCVPAAGVMMDKPFMEHSMKDFTSTIDVNLIGVTATVQLCAAYMVRQGTGGNIVCIASVAAHKAMFPQTCSAYVASKWAVRGLVKQVAGELAVHKIRCNSISSGTMMTDMLEENMRQNPGNRKQFEDSNMLKRIAKPDELNAAIVYLMSDASSYVTGNDFQVDGGMIGLMS